MLLAITTAVTFLDQLTKWLASARFGTYDQITVIPGFFALRRVYNSGAAWGMLGGQRALLIGVSVGMLGLIWHNRAEFTKSGSLARIGIGLLCGGIVGNLIDRVKFGYVIDFLDFHWKTAYTFPTFNVADAAISIGIFIYFIQIMISEKRH